MNRIDRLFAILTLLQSRKYVTAERITDKFGISERTVYRDIRALGEAGVPIQFEPHRGYYIQPGFFVPPVSFTPQEANALLLAETIVSGFADASTRKHYTSALIKVKAVLQHTQKEKVEQLEESLHIQVPPDMSLQTDYIPQIQEAISSRWILRIRYMNLKGESSERRVEPIGLLYYALGWHLIAWCQERRDYRDFKLSRMQDLLLIRQPFSNAEIMTLQEYLRRLPVNY